MKRELIRMKNRIHLELLRMHADYDVNLFTWKGGVFLRNLNNNSILLYLAVMESMETEIRKIDSLLERYRSIPGVINLQTIPGIGLFSALVIYSMIVYIQIFRNSEKLISYAGLVLARRQSSDMIHHSRIS